MDRQTLNCTEPRPFYGRCSSLITHSSNALGSWWFIRTQALLTLLLRHRKSVSATLYTLRAWNLQQMDSTPGTQAGKRQSTK